MAPPRSAFRKMVTVCKRYREEQNMLFSTDPVLAKSKTKCKQVCGKDRMGVYPAPVKLGGRDLIMG